MYGWAYLEFQFFAMGCWRQKSVLLKSYQQVFSSVSCKPLKVPWCFICQTKSPHVDIKWLKGHCILSTYTENIPNQSWGSNRWTLCTTGYLDVILIKYHINILYFILHFPSWFKCEKEKMRAFFHMCSMFEIWFLV